jgi:hypothetical protein
MIDQAVDRFERQLTHQIVGFRDDLLEREAALHTELRVREASMRAEIAACRTELREGHATLRVEIRELERASVRETATLDATLRQRMAEQRLWLLKWSLVLCLGQFVGIVALARLVLHALSP